MKFKFTFCPHPNINEALDLTKGEPFTDEAKKKIKALIQKHIGSDDAMTIECDLDNDTVKIIKRS